MTPTAPLNNWYRLCFHFPHSGDFNLPVQGFRQFRDYLNRCISVLWNCHIYIPASLIRVISNYDIWFRVVYFLQQLLVCVHTICMQISWCYNSGAPRSTSLNVFRLRQFRASRYDINNRFVKLATHSTHWVGAIFDDDDDDYNSTPSWWQSLGSVYVNCNPLGTALLVINGFSTSDERNSVHH